MIPVGITANNFYFYEKKRLNRFINPLIAFAGGLLFWTAWPVSPLTFLLFVAFVPLLWLEAKVESRKKFFGLTYITMFTWNVATTWWIWNASAPGAVAAFLANSLLMCLPWLGYKIAKKWLGTSGGLMALAAFWMCFEHIHLQDWGLSWPWLTLGNAFATHPEWVQWYEYTGTSGGTLWVLLVNMLLFLYIKETMTGNAGRNYKRLFIAVLSLALPVLLSKFAFQPPLKKSQASLQPVVIVQPNIDPYQKVSDATGSFEAQLQKLIAISESQLNEQAALLVWPETALYMGSGIDEQNMKGNFFLNPLWDFLKRHPKLTLFTGIESYRQLDHPTKYTKAFEGHFFESYNGSALLDSNGAYAFYHKSMLVPGVETLPWFLKFIDSWFEKFGGTTAGYAKQEDRNVLIEKNGYRIAPSICYESIYGEFMRNYVQHGANLVCIITNDGWWKKTPGHKQHMNYARLRAIETRTWVVRSANTGISCFIDPYGNVINPQPYNTAAAIQLTVPVNGTIKTFYTRYGDLLSKLMTGISILLLGWVMGLKARNKFFKKKFPALEIKE
ncbi:MAG: apolipoprotein N-acyltransferase [Sphingobacteriales bacterium]|nr:apolipoprotein N-acyltransferase [Sphingobacteriales bacterium]